MISTAIVEKIAPIFRNNHHEKSANRLFIVNGGLSMSHVEVDHFTCKKGCLHLYPVRLYGHHEDNFVSGFIILREKGSRLGELKSLAGPGFYSLIGPHIEEIFLRTQVVEINANVLESHLRLLTRALRRFTVVEVIGMEFKDGRMFSVIRLTLKE